MDDSFLVFLGLEDSSGARKIGWNWVAASGAITLSGRFLALSSEAWRTIYTMRDYCVWNKPTQTAMFHFKRNAYRDYSILEKFHRWNSKFCENFPFVKSNLTASRPFIRLIYYSKQQRPQRLSLPSFLPFFRFATRRKLTLFQDLPASPKLCTE